MDDENDLDNLSLSPTTITIDDDKCQVRCPKHMETECNKIYTITTQRIGEKSGTGEIYIALDENKTKYIAKKVKPSQILINSVKTQVEASKYKISPQIVQYLECHKNSFLIMEYAGSTTVNRVILETADIGEILNLINMTIECLDKFHKLGFSHGDPNLNNFILSVDNGVKLIDFELSEKLTPNKYWTDFMMLRDLVSNTLRDHPFKTTITSYIGDIIQTRRLKGSNYVKEIIRNSRKLSPVF
jgi:serine/threonine protein kinase